MEHFKPSGTANQEVKVKGQKAPLRTLLIGPGIGCHYNTLNAETETLYGLILCIFKNSVRSVAHEPRFAEMR